MKSKKEKINKGFYDLTISPKPMFLTQVEPSYNGKVIKNRNFLLD
jgi:hypothetical protein